MGYKEKFDLLMVRIYNSKSQGFVTTDIINPGYFSNNEAEIYIKDIDKNSDRIVTRINADNQLETQITFEGIVFCESDSYSKPGVPLIQTVK